MITEQDSLLRIWHSFTKCWPTSLPLIMRVVFFFFSLSLSLSLYSFYLALYPLWCLTLETQTVRRGDVQPICKESCGVWSSSLWNVHDSIFFFPLCCSLFVLWTLLVSLDWDVWRCCWLQQIIAGPSLGAAGAGAAAHWEQCTSLLGSSVYYDCQSEDVPSQLRCWVCRTLCLSPMCTGQLFENIVVCVSLF